MKRNRVQVPILATVRGCKKELFNDRLARDVKTDLKAGRAPIVRLSSSILKKVE